MVRSAVVLRVRPGKEQAYREWLVGSIPKLAGTYERAGIHAKTVLMAGTRLIAHYEGEEPDSLARAFADPDSVALLQGELAGVLDPLDGPPVIHQEIFAWQVPPPGAFERAGLVINLQPGREDAYRAWLAGALEELVPMWSRNHIYRHDVLLGGSTVVAFYECHEKHDVLKVFREPEAVAMLTGPLGRLFALDPYTPFALFTEAFSWSSARERQPA